ncbi:MAG: SurA N-terminal domain-containing protein, partial [Treponema sp.]|nr:SurA N-terminal domain-containing protein [Treponema sp.]
TYVSGNYFYQVQQSIARQYQTSMDDSNYQLTQYRIWREAFEQAVVETAILDEMKNAGYVTPTNVVDLNVAQLPDFQENGRFSSAKYNQLDNNRKMSLWRQVRDGITTNIFTSDLMAIKRSSHEADFISAMASPQRSFDMVSFPISSYPDSEIASYVQSNPSLFRITHLSRITVNSSERDAQQILTSIKNGNETFEDAAKNKSSDNYAQNSGDMGSRMVFELLIEIPDEQTREQIISLPKGEMSDVIKVSDNTWAIFRTEEAVRQADTTDPVIMDRIRSYVMTYERGRAEDWLVGVANDFITEAKAGSFDSAASARGLTKQSFGPLPLNYGDISFFSSVNSANISDLSGASTNDKFWQACFATPMGTPSEPVVLGTNVIVVIPTQETAADPDETTFINQYYTYWLSQAFDQDLRTYFLNNGKLVDKFWEMFSTLFLSNPNQGQGPQQG